MVNISLFPFFVFWVLLALSVLAMIAYRASVSRKEDDTLHVSSSAAAIPEQVTIAARLEKIDKWGKTLTIVAVVYGLLLAALFLYQNWVQSATLGV
jgi:hypothetical protein